MVPEPSDICVVDNRVFLLGLDYLYREAVKAHERLELLACARRVAQALRVAPADLPIEGYYAEEESLGEYFLLVRALQEVDEQRTKEVAALPEFQRLVQVTSAPLYGRPQWKGQLLPAGRDALSQALLNTLPHWTVPGLTDAAYAAALEFDDFSLVGLAARVRDPVVLGALRESVVLYAEMIEFGRLRRPKHAWQVDDQLARQTERFMEVFRSLFSEDLPAPVPENAEQYWDACQANGVIGRCVRLGHDPKQEPVRYYHWGICRGGDGQLTVRDFWHPQIWTTVRYRSGLGLGDRCPEV